MKVVLNKASSLWDLRKIIAFHKNQDAAATKKGWMKEQLKNPNSGIIRGETAVDKSQTDTIRLICSAEKIFVMEGNPTFS